MQTSMTERPQRNRRPPQRYSPQLESDEDDLPDESFMSSRDSLNSSRASRLSNVSSFNPSDVTESDLSTTRSSVVPEHAKMDHFPSLEEYHQNYPQTRPEHHLSEMPDIFRTTMEHGHGIVLHHKHVREFFKHLPDDQFARLGDHHVPHVALINRHGNYLMPFEVLRKPNWTRIYMGPSEYARHIAEGDKVIPIESPAISAPRNETQESLREAYETSRSPGLSPIVQESPEASPQSQRFPPTPPVPESQDGMYTPPTKQRSENYVNRSPPRRRFNPELSPIPKIGADREPSNVRRRLNFFTRSHGLSEAYGRSITYGGVTVHH